MNAICIETNGSHKGNGIIVPSKTLNKRFQRSLSFPSFSLFELAFHGTEIFVSLQPLKISGDDKMVILINIYADFTIHNQHYVQYQFNMYHKIPVIEVDSQIIPALSLTPLVISSDSLSSLSTSGDEKFV